MPKSWVQERISLQCSICFTVPTSLFNKSCVMKRGMERHYQPKNCCQTDTFLHRSVHTSVHVPIHQRRSAKRAIHLQPELPNILYYRQSWLTSQTKSINATSLLISRASKTFGACRSWKCLRMGAKVFINLWA